MIDDGARFVLRENDEELEVQVSLSLLVHSTGAFGGACRFFLLNLFYLYRNRLVEGFNNENEHLVQNTLQNDRVRDLQWFCTSCCTWGV